MRLSPKAAPTNIAQSSLLLRLVDVFEPAHDAAPRRVTFLASRRVARRRKPRDADRDTIGRQGRQSRSDCAALMLAPPPPRKAQRLASAGAWNQSPPLRWSKACSLRRRKMVTHTSLWTTCEHSPAVTWRETGSRKKVCRMTCARCRRSALWQHAERRGPLHPLSLAT